MDKESFHLHMKSWLKSLRGAEKSGVQRRVYRSIFKSVIIIATILTVASCLRAFEGTRGRSAPVPKTVAKELVRGVLDTGKGSFGSHIRPVAPDRAGKTVQGPGRVVLMAVGDIMMHASQIRAGYEPETGEYDFYPSFEYVTPVFKQADWVLGNLETRLAGQDRKFTGYPLFNSPKALARDLKKVGVHTPVNRQ